MSFTSINSCKSSNFLGQFWILRTSRFQNCHWFWLTLTDPTSLYIGWTRRRKLGNESKCNLIFFIFSHVVVEIENNFQWYWSLIENTYTGFFFKMNFSPFQFQLVDSKLFNHQEIKLIFLLNHYWFNLIGNCQFKDQNTKILCFAQNFESKWFKYTVVLFCTKTILTFSLKLLALISNNPTL